MIAGIMRVLSCWLTVATILILVAIDPEWTSATSLLTGYINGVKRSDRFTKEIYQLLRIQKDELQRLVRPSSSGLDVSEELLSQNEAGTTWIRDHSPRGTDSELLESSGTLEAYQGRQVLQKHRFPQMSAFVNSSFSSRASADHKLRRALKGLQNPRLFGGDILIDFSNHKYRRTHQKMKEQRAALVSPVNLWPRGVIYYELGRSVSHMEQLITIVMHQFHAETCIRFVRRRRNEPDYIRIESLEGCFSYIGRVGGKQILSLGGGCEHLGTVTHELLHAVGFYHHQNRSDRDDYIEIQWDNIAPGKENQFYKMEVSENNLLSEFDYDSIMLYGPRTFGKTLDRITMKPKREGVIMLEVMEKPGLSKLDIDSVNKLYKCRGTHSDSSDDDNNLASPSPEVDLGSVHDNHKPNV